MNDGGEPKLVGSVSQNPKELGQKTVQALVALSKGEEVDEEIYVDGCRYDAGTVDG